MSPDVRRRALLSAARIAMPFTLLGCAATTSPGVLPDDAAVADAPVADAASDAAPTRCAVADPGRPTDAEAACCEAIVAAAIAADAGVAEPTALACCRALATWHDQPGNFNRPWVTSGARNVCCRALDWQGSLTCTPWGPPVPPALRGDLALRPATPLDLRGLAASLAPAVPGGLAWLHEAAQETWRGRMVNEHESSAVFEALAAQLAAAGLGDDVARECRAFADEERRHGVLCGAVVTALGGEAVAPGTARPAYPAHDDVAPAEAALRNVLSVCCMSETVAVALIGAERLEMPDGELRNLLTGIWADEVGHARFGWRLVASLAPSLDDAARARLGDWLAVAFAHLERHELAHLPLATPPREGVALGLCQGADARALFFETVTEVIVPALEALGLPAHGAWANRGAPLEA